MTPYITQIASPSIQFPPQLNLTIIEDALFPIPPIIDNTISQDQLNTVDYLVIPVCRDEKNVYACRGIGYIH